MYCGIDLGTTNSLIGSGDKLWTGLVSSSVDVERKCQVERENVSDNVVSSYKVNMTTGDSGKLPIACSSVILRTLADLATRASGQTVTDVVVSVPAKFTHTQRQAVVQATENAGLTMRGLINEPTAAAIYVCHDVKDLLIVYDLGGGTFDVTVIDSRAGNYYVVATEGRILAGDDFDNALVERAYKDCKVQIRYRAGVTRKKFTSRVRLAKEAIQKSGMPQYIDMAEFGYDGMWELTPEMYQEVMKNVFAETIKLTNHLVGCYLSETESPKIVFVGGSTACPYLRKWVTEETGLQEMPCSTMPDLIVAKGVALYAEMLENGTAQNEVDDITKRLCVEDDKGMTFTVVEKNSTIPTEASVTVANPTRADVLEINLYQGDSIIASENDYIGTLRYEYGEIKEANEGWVDIKVSIDRSGLITLEGEDLLTMERQSIKLVMR